MKKKLRMHAETLRILQAGPVTVPAAYSESEIGQTSCPAHYCNPDVLSAGC